MEQLNMPPVRQGKPLEKTLEATFEEARMLQAIDAATDLEELKKVTKSVVQVWFSQKAATRWLIDQIGGR